MKTNKLLAFYSVLLTLMLVLVAVATPSDTTIETKVTYKPRRIDLAEPPPTYVNATISSRDPRWNASLVNVTSILMEGMLHPLFGYVVVKFDDYVAVFDGGAVVDIIWLKLYHMGVVDPSVHRPYKVELTITGELYDGTPFQGTGTIMVKMYHATPPPPPPPP
jgi:hypothetical protein